MARNETRLNVYFVTGEESGDTLGSDLIQSFRKLGVYVTPMGLGGERMQAEGLKSLFEISRLSVMGISGVVSKLPSLLSLIRKTANDILAKNPDVLVLIDSPEFSYRVAKRVRKKNPNIKIVKYVAPSVWAWRPGRAAKISGYVDHILAILPFEPAILKELGGPNATYVGHPLAILADQVPKRLKRKAGSPVNLVVLPGSRPSETKRLLPFMRETLVVLNERGNEFAVILPTVSRLEGGVREHVKSWPYPVQVVVGDEARKDAFSNADLALAASGTVTLELALYRIPMVSVYKLDVMAMRIRHLLTGWTASLPNLIADYPVVPERLNEYAHPLYVARMLERLCIDGPERQQQLEGFDLVAKRIKCKEAPGITAAKSILEVAEIS